MIVNNDEVGKDDYGVTVVLIVIFTAFLKNLKTSVK
jgi:hypothetical protein